MGVNRIPCLKSICLRFCNVPVTKSNYGINFNLNYSWINPVFKKCTHFSHQPQTVSTTLGGGSSLICTYYAPVNYIHENNPHLRILFRYNICNCNAYCILCIHFNARVGTCLPEVEIFLCLHVYKVVCPWQGIEIA